MRRKWAERLLAHLIPHAGEIAHLAPLRGDNEEQEFHDLLGDTASGHFVRDALFWNRCSNGTCRSPGKRAMLGSFSTASGPRRSLPTSFSSVGTHYVGSPRNSGFWLCRKNTAFFRRSRPWRQDSLLQWYSQPGKPKYHLRAAGVPLLPGAHSPQEKGAYAPRELDTFILGLSATRWAAQRDSMIFSIRHHPL